MITVLGVIPSRIGSQRLPAKPLKKILGKPMIQWVVEGAKTAKLINKIIVATDDHEVARVSEMAGALVSMTPSDLPTGTDRVWAAVKDLDGDVILNIQGDEPLINGDVLDPLVKAMLDHPNDSMGTLARKFDSDEDLLNINTAKIVLNNKGEAIYFSRLPIPYSRTQRDGEFCNLQHIGIYAYRKNFLKIFCQAGPCLMEKHEGLEQLRALYLGAKIRVVPVNFKTQGVDVPEDLKRVEEILIKRGYENV